MAKKDSKDKLEITKCDIKNANIEVVPDCNQLNTNNICSQIYNIRGQEVILDRDLAQLYNVETRVLNQAVKRNIERFPERFMFQLTQDEYKSLRNQLCSINLKSQNVTSNWGGVRKMSQKSHDRFLIIDDEVYLMGASVKDMGTSLCAITKMKMSPEIVLSLV